MNFHFLSIKKPHMIIIRTINKQPVGYTAALSSNMMFLLFCLICDTCTENLFFSFLLLFSCQYW